MLCIYSTWIHKTPLRFSVPILHASQVDATPCSSSQTVYTFSTLLNFFPVPYYCEVVAFHSFFTQTVLSFDDRNLSSTCTVYFITFSNNVPSDDFQQQPTRLLTVQRTGLLVIQECKTSSHYLHPQQLHVLCAANWTQPGHFEFSADRTPTHRKTSPIWDLQARADLCTYSIDQTGSTCTGGFTDTLVSYHFLH